MSGIQDWIYHWGEGAGTRSLKFILLLLTVAALAAVYDLRAYKNFSQPAAMEQAQLARNLAAGEGYVTKVIHPLALHLMQQEAKAKADEARRNLPAKESDWSPEQRAVVEKLLAPARLANTMPDVAYPPVYPVLLAGFMHLVPFHPLINTQERFDRYQPELLIALLNQFIFFLVAWMVYCLARRLFDASVAWLSAAVLIGTEMFWRVSVSGLSTILVIFWVLALVWCLVWLEQATEEFAGLPKALGLAALAGVVLGLGSLTRYAFAWMVVPVVIFMLSHLGGRRAVLTLAMLVTAAALVAPWLWRNQELTGTLFGTAGHVVYEGTANFPSTTLPRSLDPSFTHVDSLDLPVKLITGLREILTGDLPRLGGSWVSAFFLVGLLVPFRRSALTRLRLFVLVGLAIFVGVQALSASPRNAGARDSSPENVLIWFAPLVLIFGVGLFFTVLDQARASVWEARPLFIGGFLVMVTAPLVVGLLPPRTSPGAYPPYWPPNIQTVSGWMQPDELIMSDIPWAVAWYGNRTSVWLPLDSGDSFAAIHQQKPVRALYLTPQTLDNRFLTQWVQGENQGWGAFISQCLLRREVPTGFPLQHAYADYFPEQLFLSDQQRWNRAVP
jgi:4-amino-4-deoxy-L-arabinose transferase-like glycosyltransferase